MKLNKRGLDVKQVRRIVHDMSEWREFAKVNARGIARRDKPLTLTRCSRCGLPQLYGVFEGWKFVYGQAHNLRA